MSESHIADVLSHHGFTEDNDPQRLDASGFVDDIRHIEGYEDIQAVEFSPGQYAHRDGTIYEMSQVEIVSHDLDPALIDAKPVGKKAITDTEIVKYRTINLARKNLRG